MKFEFSTFKTVASCSLMMLANYSLSAQTKFSLDDDFVKKFNYETFYPVEYKQIVDASKTRNAYMISIDKPIPISSDELKGSFNIISDKMRFTDDGIEGLFLENELSEEVTKYFEADDSNVLLVENENTKKLYMLESSILQSMKNEKAKIQKSISDRKTINDLMQSIGYKPYQIGDNLYIKTKYYRILCNNSTYEVLQKDKDYLKKIDGWYEQQQIVRKQIIATTPKLANYVRLYRLQRNRMSKADISAWSTITKSATALNNKQVYLTDKLWGLVELNDTTKNYLKYSDEFINYLGASTGVLGL